MTAELTSEQIVTKILLSNQILKPLKGYSNVTNNVTLSSYLDNSDAEESNLQTNKSRYSFITNESRWGF